MKRFRTITLRILLSVGLLLVVLFAIALSNSRVERTEHGVHKRLLIPIGVGNAGFPTYAGTGDAVRIPGFLDGPVVRRSESGEWSASWFCEDRVFSRTGKDSELFIDCAGKHSVYPVNRIPAESRAVIDPPGKMLVLSDIEGNITFLDKALTSLGVTDANGQWQYGRNHVVIAGDAVDRGRDVFPVLWKLYRLSLQASDAGGAVHVLLGNHEQYMLRGIISRANHEHLYALGQLGGQAEAFAGDTVIGQWLRRQPLTLKAGKVLITHGGISPQVAASGLSLEEINNVMVQYWNGAATQSAQLDAALGPAGLTQYRGYFEPAEDRYPKASDRDVAQVLERFGVDHIVVGHTQVDGVLPFYNGRVWGINVNSNTARPEALLIEDGRLSAVSTGVPRQLDESRERRTRAFAVSESGDWRMLSALISSGYAQTRIPHPY